MSYILDALKRAESERERGVVPGLLSQHGPSQRDATPAHTQTPRWLLAGGAVALLLLGAGLWRWLAPGAPQAWPRPSPSVATAPVEPPAPSAVPPATLPVQVLPVPALPPSVTAPMPQAIQAPVTLSRTPVVPVTAPVVKSKPMVVTATPTEAVTLPTSTPVVPPMASSPPNPALKTGNNIPMLSDLPESVRSQIPAISIAGTVYSDSPAQRQLLTQTGVFTQGSTVAPGMLLEEIHANNAVFNFRGTRFQINY